MGETYTAQKGTPVIDGTVDDVWANAEKVQLTHVKAGDLKGDGTMPERLSVYASMLWDESAFYFLFDIHDDDFAFDSEAGDWKTTLFISILMNSAQAAEHGRRVSHRTPLFRLKI